MTASTTISGETVNVVPVTAPAVPADAWKSMTGLEDGNVYVYMWANHGTGLDTEVVITSAPTSGTLY